MANLAVFMDGTWNDKDLPAQGAISNVTRLYDAAVAGDAETVQTSRYVSGIGSQGSLLARAFEGATGSDIEDKIEEAYKFLAENYQDGDRIFLFGFSRGAYTARSVAGLLRNVGLLPATENWDAEFARIYAFYRERGEDSAPDSDRALALMAQLNCKEVNAYFVGVWETVGALGVPHLIKLPESWTRLMDHSIEFHDVRLSRKIPFAYHALAIDEHRLAFAPTLWGSQAQVPGAPQPMTQRMEQVWFAGVHTSVGGGDSDPGLSSVTLAWMATRARNAGLVVDEKILGEPAQGAELGTFQDSWSGIYEITPPYYRPICSGVAPADPSYPPQGQELLPTFETVHQSVLDRMDADPPIIPVPWDPKNLEDRLLRLPPPRFTR